MVKLGGEYLTLTGVPSKDIVAIRDDIYKLREDLQYYLEHLDESNLTESFSKTIKDEVSGDVSMITQLADQISTRVSNIAGDVSALSQRADSITARVENAEGDISTLEQTATGLTTRVATAEGDISTLDGRVDTAEGDITTLSGSISTVDQKADTISANVTNLDGRFTDFQQDVDGWEFTIGDGENEQRISINDGIVNLNDFDLSAKSLSATTSSSSVAIESGSITMGYGENPYEDTGLRIYIAKPQEDFVAVLNATDELAITAGDKIRIGDEFNRVNLDINGIPYNNCFQANRSTDTPLVAGADSLVGFNTVEHDIGGLFSLSGGSVVCSRAGKVEISGQIDLYAANGLNKQCYINLYRNGSNSGHFTRTTMTDYTTALFQRKIINVSAGDTLAFRIHMVAGVPGTAYGGSGRNFITLRYIS